MKSILWCAVVPALLSAAFVPARAAELLSRSTNVFGNFTVGYAALVDGGSFSELLSTPETAYAHTAEDAGAVLGAWNGTPVEGSAGFASATEFLFGTGGVVGSGSAATSGSTPYDYISLGANAISSLRLDFRVTEATPFVLTGDVGRTLGADMGSRVSSAQASLVFSGCVGCSWVATADSTVFAASGTLLPFSSYRISANASTRLNGDAFYHFNLQLGAVPEPSAWVTLALGLPLLLWRRVLAAPAARPALRPLPRPWLRVRSRP